MKIAVHFAKFEIRAASMRLRPVHAGVQSPTKYMGNQRSFSSACYAAITLFNHEIADSSERHLSDFADIGIVFYVNCN